MAHAVTRTSYFTPPDTHFGKQLHFGNWESFTGAIWMLLEGLVVTVWEE